MDNNDKSQRFNMYLNQSLVDGLDALSEQISVPKNSLINVAIAKLLLEFKVVEDLDASNVPAQQVLKQTDYCDLLAQGRLEKKDHVSTIERIFVNSKQHDEIRFAYYKPNKNNKERLILRPLDLTETELLQVFVDAIANNVFSADFKNKLKGML